MKIAIDISPLKSGHYLQHRVRGTGFYLQNLKSSLEKYYPVNTYTYFTRGDSIAPDIDIVHYPYFEPFFLTLPLFSKNKTMVMFWAVIFTNIYYYYGIFKNIFKIK